MYLHEQKNVFRTKGKEFFMGEEQDRKQKINCQNSKINGNVDCESLLSSALYLSLNYKKDTETI